MFGPGRRVRDPVRDPGLGARPVRVPRGCRVRTATARCSSPTPRTTGSSATRSTPPGRHRAHVLRAERHPPGRPRLHQRGVRHRGRARRHLLDRRLVQPVGAAARPRRHVVPVHRPGRSLRRAPRHHVRAGRQRVGGRLPQRPPGRARPRPGHHRGAARRLHHRRRHDRLPRRHRLRAVGPGLRERRHQQPRGRAGLRRAGAGRRHRREPRSATRWLAAPLVPIAGTAAAARGSPRSRSPCRTATAASGCSRTGRSGPTPG